MTTTESIRSNESVWMNNDQDTRQIIEAFTDPHSYLYIDEVNNTIKVSHESFIRGWDKYVAWLKEEEKQLEQYDYVSKKNQGTAISQRQAELYK